MTDKIFKNISMESYKCLHLIGNGYECADIWVENSVLVDKILNIEMDL